MFRASPGNVSEIEHLLYGENDVIRHDRIEEKRNPVFLKGLV
jgi:hypothetical protein